MQTKKEIQDQLTQSAANMQRVRQRKEVERVSELVDSTPPPAPPTVDVK